MANKNKKCKWCKEYVEASTGLQTPAGFFCCFEDAIEFSRDKGQKKAAREQKRAKVERKKTFLGNDRSYQLKKSQESFNAYIRERDKDAPCISCNRHHKGQYHAGHYRSVGAIRALRFNQFNVSRQCSACNVHLSGNIHGYRKGLLQKFGSEKVEWLEGNHEPAKLSLEEIKAIRIFYQKMLKRIKE